MMMHHLSISGIITPTWIKQAGTRLSSILIIIVKHRRQIPIVCHIASSKPCLPHSVVN